MRRTTLTAFLVEKQTPPATGREDYFDTTIPSLAFRITAGGRRSFAVRARTKGSKNPTWHEVGRVPGMTVKEARDKAGDILRACQAVVAKRKATKRDFATAAEAFIGYQSRRRPRSSAHTAAEIRRYLVPKWGNRQIAAITAADIVEIIKGIQAAGHPHMARLVLAHIKVLFRWLSSPVHHETDHLKINPAIGLSASKDFEIELAPRQVNLSAEHLQLIWKAAGTLGPVFGPFVRMLMLSGQRRNEIADMQWSELDLDRDRVWIVPVERMKAKRAHEVPLTTAMIDLLRAMPEPLARHDFVFSTTFGERPVSGFSKVKARLDKAIAVLAAREGLESPPDWRLHDLRRAVRTALGALPSVPHDIRELVIAHVPAPLVQTYDLHAYRDEKRAALELWNDRLMAIVA